MLLHLSILLILGTTVSAEKFNCTKELQRINGNSGTLVISKANSFCGFLTQDDTTVFALKIDDLRLKAGDSVSIGPDRNATQTTYEPPFYSGYLFSGVREPKITFNFKTTSDEVMEVEFIQNVAILPLDGDKYNDFEITPDGMKAINITFSKTVSDLVHLEVIGASIKGNRLGHMLISESTAVIPIDFINNQIVKVRTSPALANCSATYVDSAEKRHEISGPVPKDIGKKYSCVNIFKTSLPNRAHYEANFKDFIDLGDDYDELTLIDGTADGLVEIVDSNARNFVGKILAFDGPDLVVIYQNLRKSTSSEIQFKLTVDLKSQGGVLKQAGPLEFPPAGEVRFVLKPEPQKFASIEISSPIKLQGVSVAIHSEDKLIANFADGSMVPAVIALDKPGASMILNFSGKSYDKLKSVINFKPSEKHCHKISADRFFITGPAGPCYWLITNTDLTTVKIEPNGLGSKGLLTMQSLLEDKPFFSISNTSDGDLLPEFNVKQALINVTLPEGAKFEASSRLSSYAAQTDLKPKQSISIMSPSYPAPYGWYPTSSSYSLNATNKNYVISIKELDLRTGEKLLIDKQEINNSNKMADIILSNVTSVVTISRNIPNDFSLRRGYLLVASEFDHVVQADPSKKQLIIPKNLTNCLVKITFPGANFGKRVSFNLTVAPGPVQEISLFDGRSLSSSRTNIPNNTYRGLTTSDTLLLSFKTTKENASLSDISIDYEGVACDKSDHVCDNNTRCVGKEKLCKGVSYCDDHSDIKTVCSAGPAPAPEIIQTGYSGISFLFFGIFMLSLGLISAIYGPDLYRALENRFRSGQYTTFTSTE